MPPHRLIAVFDMIMEGAVAISGGKVESQAPEFDRVVELHQRKIYFLALDLTGNHHDAEDLAQEVFLKAYKGLKRFRGEAGLGTWLYRIALNTHIDRGRRKSVAIMKRQRSWDDEENPLPPLPDRNPERNPERSAEAGVIQRHIDQALNRLSPQQRTIFVLRHYQDLKLREIASLLSISEGTVKTTLFRAIRRLQQELSAYRPELGLESAS